MPWQKIDKTEISSWNEKLKATNASFYQYPYFISTEYLSYFSKPVFLQYKENNEIFAYAAILEIGISNYKLGIVEDGPVILNESISSQILLNGLKDFAAEQGYIHLQVRPLTTDFLEAIKQDNSFEQKVYFPFHQKEDFCWNIYNQEEDKLLAGFKLQCRRKIVLAGRHDYVFKKVENEDDLKKVYIILKTASKEKKYLQRSYTVFKKMYAEGKKYGLAEIYIALLKDEIINAVFIVKDAESFYHLSSAVILKGYPVNESPPAKLHLFLMKDQFYNEQKKYYNISYGGNENLIRFKELFNPVEIEKAPYYTYVLQPKKLALLEKLNPGHISNVRSLLKKVGKLFD